MKFALINNERREAEKGISGSCPTCNQVMIAKCGNTIIHHWSHKGKLECDPWWENETEWHRAWKNKFINDWQEISHTDPITGEIHRADVKTPKNLVIEFQNSPIQNEERKSREIFYKNMIWIVNGTRRTKDHEKFSIEVEWLSRLDGNENELVTEKEAFRSPLADFTSADPGLFTN
jgi:competence protein CoiA